MNNKSLRVSFVVSSIFRMNFSIIVFTIIVIINWLIIAIHLQRPPDTSYKEHTAIRAARCDTQPPDQTMQEPRASQDPH